MACEKVVCDKVVEAAEREEEEKEERDTESKTRTPHKDVGKKYTLYVTYACVRACVRACVCVRVCVRVCARVFSYEERIVWPRLFIEFWNPSTLEMTQTTSQTTQFGTICIHFTIMFPLTAIKHD